MELDLVEEIVPLQERELTILRPRSSEALLDEEAFEHEEFLPYWAELWPSGVALARTLSGRALRGARTLELAELNAARNGVSLELIRCSWAEPGPIVERGPWDLVLAADVLYERRNVEQLLALLARLVDGGEVLLADPGRPHARSFLEQAARGWQVEKTDREAVPIYKMKLAAGGTRSPARGAIWPGGSCRRDVAATG